MESDRELLEMAAKAMGERVPPRFYPDGSAVLLSGQCWNPLTDDGDALRLAVKLRLSLSVDDRPAGVVRVYVPDDKVPAQDEPATPDPYAATRRAVVRAAAELGKRT